MQKAHPEKTHFYVTICYLYLYQTEKIIPNNQWISEKAM